MKRALALVVLVGCAAQPAKIPADPPAPLAPVTAAAPVVVPASVPDLDDATVKAKSHELFDALDRGDISAFEGMVAPSFVFFERERYLDAALLVNTMKSRNDRHVPVSSRSWQEERVYRSGNSAVFIGHAIQHVPAFGDQKPVELDAFETVFWVRSDAAWKVAGGEAVHKMSKGEYWDDMFKSSWGFKPEANQLLVDTVKGVKPGAALDLATGQGRNSVFLATQGWKTTGIDVSKVGLEFARAQAAEKKVKVDTVEADMEQYDLGKNKWDLVTMIYCGTSKTVVAKIKPSVKKGGLFVTEYFHIDSEASKAGAGGWQTGELKTLFSDGWDILRDDVVDDVADWTRRNQKLVRFVARKK